jgi:hypothetical protein
MLGYDFEIIYKKNMWWQMTLSRKEEDTKGLLCVIYVLQSNWVEEAMIQWKQYQNICNIIQQLQEDPSTLDKFVWKNDSLWYQDHLYLCKNSQPK